MIAGTLQGAALQPTVIVRLDRVYGKVTCYPVNPAAHTVCRLTGKKTFSPEDLDAMLELGFTLECASVLGLADFMRKADAHNS